MKTLPRHRPTAATLPTNAPNTSTNTTSNATSNANATKRTRRRHPQSYKISPFPCLPRRISSLLTFNFNFNINQNNLHNLSLTSICQSIGDCILFLLGPFLICVVFALVYVLSRTFFMILLPLMTQSYNYNPHTITTSTTTTTSTSTSTMDQGEGHVNNDHYHNNIIINPDNIDLNHYTADNGYYNGYGIYATSQAMKHELFIVFILYNIIFNYLCCVLTRNSGVINDSSSSSSSIKARIGSLWRKSDDLDSNISIGLGGGGGGGATSDNNNDMDPNNDNDNAVDSENNKYGKVVHELATMTQFHYPQTKEEKEKFRFDYRQRIVKRSRAMRERRRYDSSSNSADGSGSTTTTGTNGTNMQGRYNGEPLHLNPDTTTTTTTTTNNSTTTATKNNTTNSIAKMNAAATKPWMLLGPYDWGYCEKSKLPKPPRSHYDYVTRSLILNMDHYCPWMFNVVGYFNYRYFMNFLIYVAIGMMYGTIISFRFFMLIETPEYHDQISRSQALMMAHDTSGNNMTETATMTMTTTMTTMDNGQLPEQQNHRNLNKHEYHHNHQHRNHKSPRFKYKYVKHLIPNIPTPTEYLPIYFCFMICLAVGLAVIALLSFHLYLVFTSQTTIEFHGNLMKKRMAREYDEDHNGGKGGSGSSWRNPYDLGWKRNLEQVWGSFGVEPLDNSGCDRGRLVTIWYRMKFIGSFLKLLLPSRREPEFLPVPIKGDIGRRRTNSNRRTMMDNHYDLKKDCNDEEMENLV